MARFTVDPDRLNYTLEQSGKEYNLRLLQRAQVIFSTLLSTLPSNYVSTIQGPNYTNELKAVAVELARIELALEDVSSDLDASRTRSEFLYSIVGYMCFLNDRLPNLNYDDREFRTFLATLVRIYFQGSVPTSIKEAVSLFLKTENFQILENFLLTRQGGAGVDISDQFGFQIGIPADDEFPADIFDLQSAIRIILDIVRPAHTLFTIRFIFTDSYVPNDEFGRILDSMKWKLQAYYYEDLRSYWTGLRDIDRLGRKVNQTVVGEDHSADF